MLRVNETNYRALLKAISWRLFGSLATFLLVFLLFGKATLAAGLTFLEVITKLLLYYFHERIWNLISSGRHIEVNNNDKDSDLATSNDEHLGCVIWFTGLPSAGKTTLAKALEIKLLDSKISNNQGRIQLLDGDEVRNVINNTGFTEEERNTHIRQMGFVASLLEKNGVTVISSFVSPYRSSRNFARNLCKNFIEIHVATNLETCQERDVKGLYKKALAGEITNLTGLGDIYEAPDAAEIVIDTSNRSINQCVEEILDYLKLKNYITNQLQDFKTSCCPVVESHGSSITNRECQYTHPA